MKIRSFLGIDPETGYPLSRLEHPFLAKAEKRLVRVPGIHKTKSGREIPCQIVVHPAAFKKPPKRFGAKEQERAARSMANEG